MVVAAGCVPRVAAGPSPLAPPHPEPELVMVQHRVGPGETLYRIARTYGLPADALAAANDVRDPGSLQVGQVLVIPGASAVKKVVPPGAQEAREVARLEVDASEYALAVDPAFRKAANEALLREGFKFVALDLEPFRSGRMNEAAGVLKAQQPAALSLPVVR